MTTTTIEQLPDQIKKALKDAFNYGQTYFSQADSESISQQNKSDATRDKFHELVTDTIAALPLPVMPEQAEPVAYQSRFKPDRNAGYWRSWQPCSKRSHENHIAEPKNGDCFYETRALYDQDPSALLARISELEAENQKLKEGLKYYADGHHFTKTDEDAWDTVSGEPANFYEDENSTAIIEDGSIAKQVLAGNYKVLEDDET